MSDKADSFSGMLCETRKITPEKGELTGTCCICGKTTNVGFKKKFGANFTCADYVSGGDVICPECNILVKNSNEYRRTMFLLTEDDFIKFKKKEAKNIVFNLPDKPFYLYLTKTWQKIGWIRMNDVYNTGNTGTLKFLVDYDIIHASLDEIQDNCNFIKELRSLKIPKPVLETGELEMHHYNKLVEEYGKKEARSIMHKLKDYAGTPSFDLSLYLED